MSIKKQYGGPYVKDTETFIQKACWRHGEYYDYSGVEYVRGADKVEIVCKKHGMFKQKASDHLMGKGCPVCGRERTTHSKKKNGDLFISLAKNVHGGFYDYSRCKYTGCHDKVIIICPRHGSFEQSANNHLRGHGCAECKYSTLKWGSSFPDKMNLYVFSMENKFLKIGISKNVGRRKKEIERNFNMQAEVICARQGETKDIFELEQLIVRGSGFNRYKHPHKVEGHLECLEIIHLKDVLEIIERKFK